MLIFAKINFRAESGIWQKTTGRKGSEWYVGAMTDWSKRSLTLDLAFLPEGEYVVELYKDGADDKEKLRLYRDTYANSTDKIIRLNTGPYRLLAQHGDSLGCGFEKPYFIADHHFELTPAKTKETVSAVARLGNVQLAVSFHETITGS